MTRRLFQRIDKNPLCKFGRFSRSGEMRAAIRIGDIILLVGEASLFAKLRTGNTETYVFLVAEDT